MTAAPRTGYAPVHGLNMYYEIHGAGQPLVLLHGGLGTIHMLFGPLLPALAQTRQVIAVELQGHGHTADIDRPLSFERMADDVAALIEQLGIERADIFGYSLGGGVALQTAIRRPQLVRKLVIVSAPCQSDGWYPAARAGMASVTAAVAKEWVGSPMHQAYASVAPRPEDWPTLADKLGQLLRQEYDWSAATARIQAPALIVVGDADGVRPEHAVDLFRLLGGDKANGGMGELPRSQLAVLPGTTHLDVLTRVDLLASIIPPFLDAPMPAAK
jgi:pimeloyl-ACP methyl ester carboxylesterase